MIWQERGAALDSARYGWHVATLFMVMAQISANPHVGITHGTNSHEDAALRTILTALGKAFIPSYLAQKMLSTCRRVWSLRRSAHSERRAMAVGGVVRQQRCMQWWEGWRLNHPR